LLAALGLAEHAAGRDDRAGKFLEAAVAANTARSRAYLELARLRLKESEAHPAVPGGRISDDQLAAVLKPLFAARIRPPPLPEVYETIAEAWSHAAMQPGKGHLGAVDEGVSLFPYDTELVYADALLQSRIGDKTAASALCDLGLEYAVSPDSRGRFLALKAKNQG
jgi:hypothetical protein